MLPLTRRAVLCACALAPPVAAQIDWQPLVGGSVPPARDQSALATDFAGGGLLMFGGGGNGGALGDTWRWQAGSWQALTPAQHPPARYGVRMAADPVRQRVVLFGGYDQSINLFGDTWEWDGANWTQLQPATSPAPRNGHVMAWDAPNGRVMLYGGGGAGSIMYYDTWLWDGSQWTQVLTPASPRDVGLFGMVSDGARDRVVMVGSSGVYEWDGTLWTWPGAGPGGYLGSLAYDSARQHVVCYGGGNNNGLPLNLGVREWTGQQWVQRQTATNPPLRIWNALGYDPETEHVVCFGGRDDTQPAISIRKSDTWVLAPVHAASVRTGGSGCTGSGGVLQLDAIGRAWIGEPFAVRWSNLPTNGAFVVLGLGWSYQQWGTLQLPLPLQSFGMPGCSLYQSMDAVVAATAGSSTLTQTLAAPLAPSLLDLDVYLQGFALDPPANAAGVTASNGLALHTGTR